VTACYSLTAAKSVTIATTVRVLRFQLPTPSPGSLSLLDHGVERFTADDLKLPASRRLLAAAAAENGRPTPSAAALMADLRGYPRRSVRAWAAIPAQGRLHGLIGLLQPTGASGERFSIPWLVVDPAERRRGVATRLVHEVLAAAGRAGAEVVCVETLATWPAATAFWTRMAATAATSR